MLRGWSEKAKAAAKPEEHPFGLPGWVRIVQKRQAQTAAAVMNSIEKRLWAGPEPEWRNHAKTYTPEDPENKDLLEQMKHLKERLVRKYKPHECVLTCEDVSQSMVKTVDGRIVLAGVVKNPQKIYLSKSAGPPWSEPVKADYLLNSDGTLVTPDQKDDKPDPNAPVVTRKSVPIVYTDRLEGDSSKEQQHDSLATHLRTQHRFVSKNQG